MVWIMNAVIGFWLLSDTDKRRASKLPWVLWGFLLPVLTVPLWLAKRPLLDGETREGGVAWNLCKYFAIFWTLFIIVVTISALAKVGDTMNPNMSTAESIGTGLGVALGLGMYAMLWFFGIFGALVLGLFLKKSSLVEHGPTEPVETPAGYAVAGVIVGGLAMLGLFLG